VIDRIALNDSLTALMHQNGALLDDDDLNDLTHTVADIFEEHQVIQPKGEKAE
jgi:hypothetical protein